MITCPFSSLRKWVTIGSESRRMPSNVFPYGSQQSVLHIGRWIWIVYPLFFYGFSPHLARFVFTARTESLHTACARSTCIKPQSVFSVLSTQRSCLSFIRLVRRLSKYPSHMQNWQSNLLAEHRLRRVLLDEQQLRQVQFVSSNILIKAYAEGTLWCVAEMWIPLC